MHILALKLVVYFENSKKSFRMTMKYIWHIIVTFVFYLRNKLEDVNQKKTLDKHVFFKSTSLDWKIAPYMI